MRISDWSSDVCSSDLPMPALPAFSFAKLQAVAPAAFTIAFLAGIEALLSCVIADGMTGFRHRSNQELVGQGVANLASGLFGGRSEERRVGTRVVRPGRSRGWTDL